jgi:hypothetical protein
MILVYTVSTAYSIAVDPAPARENSTTSKRVTMMSDHNEELDNQVIIFNTIPYQTYGRGPLTLSATTSSGLDVSFTVVFGPALLDGNMLSFTNWGTVRVEASQEGDEYYNPASKVTQTFEVISAWDTWQMTHFLEAERSQPSISGDAADADGDGLLNLVEYALGLNPRIPSRLIAEGAVLTTNENVDAFVIKLSRNPDALDTSITIEESVDLASWNPVATSENGSTFQTSLEGYSVTETNGGGVMRVELSSPFSSSAGYFKRIIVVR